MEAEIKNKSKRTVEERTVTFCRAVCKQGGKEQMPWVDLIL